MNYLTFLRWLLSHAELIAPLFELANAVYSAPTLADKWEAIKAIGDKVLPVLGDMPTGIVTTNESDEAAEIAELEEAIVMELRHRDVGCGTLTALAWDGSKLRKLFEVVQIILPLLLALKG